MTEKRLLADTELALSSVVANNAMNRLRGLAGNNSRRVAPPCAFDLITCVHGSHYVGDKLGVLAKVGSWLTGEGTPGSPGISISPLSG